MTLEQAIAEIEECVKSGVFLDSVPVKVLLDHVKNLTERVAELERPKHWWSR